MRPIKIAYMLDSFHVGGTELNAVRTAEALDRSAFELLVFHLRDAGPLKARYEALGVPLRHVPIPNLYSPRTVRQALALCGRLRSERVDVVHAHDVYANIFIGPWARLLTRGAVICSRRWGAAPSDPRLAPLNRLSYRFADRVLCNSASVAEHMVANEGVPRRKIVCIPNFLDERAFDAGSAEERARQRRRWGVPEGAFLIGAVCRLSPVKNLELLIDVVAALGDDLQAVVIGDGPSKAALEALVSRRNLAGRVRFVGEMLDAGNLHRFFDLSVSCSHSEGFPNSLIEAMAVGNPIVATDVGGVPDAVTHGETGELVPAGDREALVRSIRRLRADPALAERYGRCARDRARAQFSRDMVVSRLEAVYRSLADRASADAH